MIDAPQSDAASRDADERALPLGNDAVAAALDETAELLDAQDANPFRVRAYREAARTVRLLEHPLHDLIAADGAHSLVALPAIGESIARAIERLVSSGHLGLLDRLRGEERDRDVFTSVAGIGPALAARIHEELGIATLPELLAAAHDGSLRRVPGIGERRVRAVRDTLTGRGRASRPRVAREPGATGATGAADEPDVAELLDVDEEYREKARRRELPRIAPKRFNPTRDAWLPILHTERGGRHYTALFSNTARAHELGTTDDWVVVYRDDHGGSGQWTVVTGQFGALRGRRIVRGRERECRALSNERRADP